MTKSLEFSPMRDGTCCIEVREGNTTNKFLVIEQNWFNFGGKPCEPDRLFSNAEQLSKALNIVKYLNSPATHVKEEHV